MRRLFALVILSVFPLIGFAQFSNRLNPGDLGNSYRNSELHGTISGLPDDQQICSVELKDIQTGKSVANTGCDRSRGFEFLDLTPGSYELVVSVGVKQFSSVVDINTAREDLSIEIPKDSLP